MFGTFDWQSMRVVGRVEAGIWFWMFMLLVSLILLNMFMAIVLDAYEHVRSMTTTAPTLWEDLKSYHKMALGWYNGELLSYSRMKKAIKARVAKVEKSKKTEDDDDSWGPTETLEDLRLITPAKFMEVVKGLKKRQATEVIEQCITEYYMQERPGVSMERLRVWVDNLLVNLKDWKHALRVTSSDAPGPHLSDVAGDLRRQVMEVWAKLDQTLVKESLGSVDAVGEVADDSVRDVEIEDDEKIEDDTPRVPDDPPAVLEPPSPPSKEQLERLAHLEAELSDVRTWVTEVLSAVSTLQTRVARQQKLREDLDKTGKQLHDRGLALRRENRKLKERRDEMRIGNPDIEVDDESFVPPSEKDKETLTQLIAENERLRKVVANSLPESSQGSALGNPPQFVTGVQAHSAGAHAPTRSAPKRGASPSVGAQVPRTNARAPLGDVRRHHEDRRPHDHRQRPEDLVQRGRVAR